MAHSPGAAADGRKARVIMMDMASTTLMSFAEFEQVEQGADQIELLNGELIRMAPAENSHMDICEALYNQLGHAVERLREANPGRQLGKVHMERGYRFLGEQGSWFQPDVSLTHPDQPVDRYYIGAPLIAFQVVSPSDTARHLDEKISVYLANGAPEVWLIYPDGRHAWIYDGSGAASQEDSIL
jgi:Uma2 family endonuclease